MQFLFFSLRNNYFRLREMCFFLCAKIRKKTFISLALFALLKLCGKNNHNVKRSVCYLIQKRRTNLFRSPLPLSQADSNHH